MKNVAHFLYENIILQFGCPIELISNWGTRFLNETIQELTNRFLIKYRRTAPYHPWANKETEKKMILNKKNYIFLVKNEIK